MVELNAENNLSQCLKAVSDGTRRALLTQLCQQGPCRVTDLASYYQISLNGISKHLKILENAGLVTRTTEGREHWIRADLEKISIVEEWFRELKSIWLQSLDQLEKITGEY